MRHYEFDCKRDKEGFFFEVIRKALEANGYKYVANPYTGGDNDRVIVDTVAKQWAFFERGTAPHYEDLPFMDSKSLADLIRYKHNDQ